MKLKLIHNFWEPWMAAFDTEGQPFRLVTTDGPSRIEMINIFKHAGLSVPLFGKYNDFVRWGYRDDRKVVIHKNIYSHCGEGKELKYFNKLTKEDKQNYLMEYVEFPESLDSPYYAKSTRFLFVGNDYCFKYHYYSSNDWRSNCGDGEITEPINIEIPNWRYCIYYPFFAVDFVGPDNCLKAIDLNIAPGIDRTGVEKIISPLQIILAIKKWFLDVQNNEDTKVLSNDIYKGLGCD